MRLGLLDVMVSETLVMRRLTGGVAFGTRREAEVESSSCDDALGTDGTSGDNSKVEEESQVFIKSQHIDLHQLSNFLGHLTGSNTGRTSASTTIHHMFFSRYILEIDESAYENENRPRQFFTSPYLLSSSSFHPLARATTLTHQSPRLTIINQPKPLSPQNVHLSQISP